MLPVETHLKTTAGKPGGQTIATDSLDQRHHILNQFSLSAGHVARLQPGGLPAVCWEVSVGSAGWLLAAPSLSCGLLVGLLLGVQRTPPRDRLRVVGGWAQGPEQGQQG